MERIRLTASEEMSFENVDGRRTDDGRRMPVYTISSPVSLRLRWAKIWLERKANINLQVDLKNILFSSTPRAFLSYFFTVAKYFIYNSNFNLKKWSIKGFENFLKQKIINEMYIAKINKTYDKFLGKWSSLYNYMITV